MGEVVTPHMLAFAAIKHSSRLSCTCGFCICAKGGVSIRGARRPDRAVLNEPAQLAGEENSSRPTGAEIDGGIVRNRVSLGGPASGDVCRERGLGVGLALKLDGAKIGVSLR